MSHTPDNNSPELEYHLVQVDDNNKQKLLGNSNIKIIDAGNLSVNEIAALQSNCPIGTSSSNPNLSSINSLEPDRCENNGLNAQITPNNHIIIYDNSSKIEPPPRYNHLKKIGNLAASQTIGNFQNIQQVNNSNDDRARQIAQQIVEGESFMNISEKKNEHGYQVHHNTVTQHTRHININ